MLPTAMPWPFYELQTIQYSSFNPILPLRG